MIEKVKASREISQALKLEASRMEDLKAHFKTSPHNRDQALPWRTGEASLATAEMAILPNT